jgi:integrase
VRGQSGSGQHLSNLKPSSPAYARKDNGHGAEESADFLEFLGHAGLGQAEARALSRADVDFEAGQVRTFRQKTSTGFAVPIYPQLRPLLEKLEVARVRLIDMRIVNLVHDAMTKREPNAATGMVGCAHAFFCARSPARLNSGRAKCD